MVAFAPTVPSPNIAATADPEYTSYRWSRPIGSFAGNKGTGEAIEGVGKALEGGVNAADTLVKNTLTNSIEDTAGNVRDKYSANLDQALALANANTEPEKKLDLLSSPDKASAENVPKDLKGLPDLLSKMDAQNANGKVSETKYRGDLSSLAKQYRAAWPGYREYIDSQFSKVTDTGPANDYIRTQVASLNAYVTAAKEGKAKDETLAVEGIKNIKGFDVTANDWHSGKISTEQMRHAYNQGMSWKFDQEKANSDFDVAEKNTKLKALTAEKAITQNIATPIKSIFATLTGADRLDKVEADLTKGDYNPEHAQMLSTHIASIIQQAKTAAQQLAEQRNAKGESWAENVGGARLKELIDNEPTVQRAEGIIKLLNAGSHDVAGLALRSTKAQLDEMKKDFFANGGDAAKDVKMFEILKDAMGPNQGEAMAKMYTQGRGLQDGIDFLRDYTVAGGTQPNKGDPNTPEEKQIVTMKHAVDAFMGANVKDPAAYKRLYTDIGQHIADPAMSSRLKLGWSEMAFDERNIPLLNQFEKDHIDPQTNKVIAGPVWLYQQLTGKGNAESIEELDRLYPGSGIKNKYLNYVEKAGQQLITQEVSRPQWPQVMQKAGAAITAAPGKITEGLKNPDQVKVSFDNENFKFTALPNPPTGHSGGKGSIAELQVRGIQEYIDRVNIIMGAVQTTSKMGGEEPNAYIYKLLAAMGPNINPLADKMMQAVIQANTKKQEGEGGGSGF